MIIACVLQGIGTSIMFCNGFLLMITVCWTIFFQEILGYTPFQAGSLSSFSTAPVTFFAPVAGYLVDRFGPRLPVALGFSVIMFSLTLFLCIVMHQVSWLFILSLFFFGMTIPFILHPSYISIRTFVKQSFSSSHGR